jgi:trans-aconitate 2-methyltransferase
VATPWDARTYDATSEPQQEWAAEVVARLEGIAPDAHVLDVGCGTGRVTESLLALVPDGRVLAIDASEDMVGLARERPWRRLAGALLPGGVLEVQCGGEGNIDRVCEVIDRVAGEGFPELVGFSPWVFASPSDTEARLRAAGFTSIRCWLEQRPTYPRDLGAFVRTSILAAHFQLLPEERREPFAEAVLAGVRAPLDYVRLNVSAVRAED